MSGMGRKLSRLKMPGAPVQGAPAPGAFAGESKLRSPRDPGDVARAAAGDLSEGFAAGDRASRIERLRAQMAFTAARTGVPATSPRRTPEGREAENLDPELFGGGLPGERAETPTGVLRTVRTEYAADHCHGTAPVAGALSACAEQLSILALDPALREVDLGRALFVDTETTGLAGGAGTVPFLIGVAFFEGERLVVEQYLLEQLGQEGPMLERLGAHLQRASCLVSYNGKSFDWPLLRTRFVLHRVPARPPSVHLDLLHCARRVFKARLGGVRLVSVEEEVLGFTRVDDIPGSLIPETYLGYLRGRVPGEALAPIVEHNKHDLVALAALLGELSRRFSLDGEGQDARDRVGMAQTAARALDTERAIRLAQAAADADVRGELASHACWLAGCWAKRRGDYPGAQLSFEKALEHARDAREAAAVHLELAKLLEHQRRCYRAALVHAEATAPAEGDEACTRRIARLRRKLGRSEPSPELRD